MRALIGAGRELDALVAQKVMGYEVVGWGEVTEGCVFFDMGERDPLYLRHCACESVRREMKTRPEEWKFGHWFDCLSGVHHYSTDIAAAWEVVERMDSLGWWPTVNRVNLAERQWEAVFQWGLEDEAVMVYEFAAIAPLAICLAALKAVGA